ncbi:MAG: KilA-N domain-containing protein [Candidatus Riflebacteria bacterium]|nr:KilA-N domain-containing protein [Candidatus Riflebacteria bacterium]
MVQKDYICITDIARYKDPDRTDYIIQNWMRNRNTVELFGIWERINNPDFNPIEFEGFKNQVGLNSFVLTAKQRVEKTNAIGIFSKSGRYGGIFAHKDAAFEFALWVLSSTFCDGYRICTRFSEKEHFLDRRSRASPR